MHVERGVWLEVRYHVGAWKKALASHMKVYANGEAVVTTSSGTMRFPPIAWRRL